MATVRVFPPDFFCLLVQVVGYGRRGTLQHLKPFRFRRYRRAHAHSHFIACAHCNALQTLPCTPPHAPYFPISSWNLVPMDRNWSIGHNHVEISANFTLLRFRGYRHHPIYQTIHSFILTTSFIIACQGDLLHPLPSSSILLNNLSLIHISEPTRPY